MSENYQHLGIFSDWVAEAKRQQPLFPLAQPGSFTQQRVREVLGFCSQPEEAQDVKVERTWQRDGVAGEEVSWSVGYGPRTYAYVLKPAQATTPLPGLVALHDHGGFKFYGKEKIADGPDALAPIMQDYRQEFYGGQAYANVLAKAGYVVLVHDTFMWSSRGFPLETMLKMVGVETGTLLMALSQSGKQPNEIDRYNIAAGFHENWLAKYSNVLGTSVAGVVSHEDRIATNYLLSRPDVDAQKVGCIGLSGGGNRAAMLNATHDSIKAAVIVGLMTTYEALLDHQMSHTWMLFPYGWSRYGDWPDLAACRAPSPLLVQYNQQDQLFTEAGMNAAHARLSMLFEMTGRKENYVGQFFSGPHKFDLEMQAQAFAWLKQTLR